MARLAAGERLALGEPLPGDWSEKWGPEAARRLVHSGEEVDGVIRGSDQIARGVADGLRENGVDVPGTIAVIGVHNWDLMVEASRPP